MRGKRKWRDVCWVILGFVALGYAAASPEPQMLNTQIENPQNQSSQMNSAQMDNPQNPNPQTNDAQVGNLQNQNPQMNNAQTKTAITYDKTYEKEIKSAEEAIAEIRKEGENQRELHTAKEICDIEKRMEETYGILQVNLGEMDGKMAERIESAFFYMFQEYPSLYGSLTNVTLGNLEEDLIAVTEYTEFISPKEQIYPIVMKRQIVLSGRNFLNENRLENLIEKSVAEGHWQQDMSVEAIVVHELGHVLVGNVRMENYGLKNFYYIEEENADAFASYQNDVLAEHQTTAEEILNNAYQKDEVDAQKTLREVCGEISGYAEGLQEDGGISYEEACAEAVVDVYLHGEKAHTFSKSVVEELKIGHSSRK